VTGYFFRLANGIISWQPRSQKTIALSSTEAEYMALSDCSRQAVWMKTVFSELEMPLGTIPICGDNQGSIFISSNPVQERRSKHIDIRYHYVRDCIEDVGAKRTKSWTSLVEVPLHTPHGMPHTTIKNEQPRACFRWWWVQHLAMPSLPPTTNENKQPHARFQWWWAQHPAAPSPLPTTNEIEHAVARFRWWWAQCLSTLPQHLTTTHHHQ